MSEPGGWRTQALFLARFFRHPRTVGAIAPSSSHLARAMLDGVVLSGAAHVVELGPGTGSFTREILARLGPAGRYLGIEADPQMAAIVRGRWPDADVVCESAERLREIVAARDLPPVGTIVCGLPWASLPASAARGIMDAIAGTLAPGGTFVTFQYVHAYLLPPAVVFRREMTSRLGPPRITATVARNLPPAFVLRWIAPAGRATV